MKEKTFTEKEVVICGRNYGNLLAIARDLGESGYNVSVLRLHKKKPKLFNLLSCMKPERYSKYVKKYAECIVNDNPNRFVDKLICLATEEKQMLLPTDDYSAYLVDSSLIQLNKYYYLPSISNEANAIVKHMDKCSQKQLAKEFGLNVLHSALIHSEQGEFKLPKAISYPCFIKPNISLTGTKGKMCKCENEHELRDVLENYAVKEDFEVLVEDFADIKTEYAVLGLSTGDTIIAPGFFKTIYGGHNERKGVAVVGEFIETKGYEKIINKCCKYVESLKYIGLFDIDLIETQNGDFYFVELNFRAGASTRGLTKCGVNLAGMFVDNLVWNIPIDKNCKVELLNRRFLSEKVLLEEYLRDDIGFINVRKLIKDTGVHFIEDENDLKPYRYFKGVYIIAFLIKPIYRIKNGIKKRTKGENHV